MCSGLLGCQTLGDCKELTSAMSHLRVGFPSITKEWAFPGGSVGKEFACNAGDIRDTSLIPESGRSSRGRNGNPLQFLAWESPWTEEPSRLQSMVSQELDMT